MNVRRISIIVLMLVAASAASSFAADISFGAKAGLTASNITGMPDALSSSVKYRTSITGGIFLNYALNDAFSLQPELLYVPKGCGGDFFEGIIEVSPHFTFLELPVLAKYTFLSGGTFRPCIFAGPSIGFALKSELRASVWWVSHDFDISNYTNDTDFGIVAGTGFGYETGMGLLIFDARFQRGFTDIIETIDFDFLGSTQTIHVDQFKHYGFSFMVGFQF